MHVAFSKPAAPADVRHWEVASFALLPNGRDAVVYMTGQVMVTTGSFRGPSWSMSAYRIALDGKSDAQQLFRVDHGFRLHMSKHGAVFAMNKHPGRKCDHGECLFEAIVAYELTDTGVKQTTLFDARELSMGQARLVRGSDEERVALLLDGWSPRRIELLHWRYGAAEPATDIHEPELRRSLLLGRDAEERVARGREAVSHAISGVRAHRGARRGAE
ncbi:hypothetical protein, partial [Archangium sp.]|uniref:hypothetical protein n=1 Tax=Archangium sp. TaxID=1872627 RepID=UPI002D6EC01B